MEKPEDKTEFPLHHLDYVSLNEILKNLSLVDIFELSFTTKEVKNTLAEANIPIKSMRIDFDPKMPMIHIKSVRDEFMWTFGYPPGFCMRALKNEYKIEQFSYECKKSVNGYHTLHHDMEGGMIAVIRHLVSIFNCSDAIVDEISIDLAVIGDSRSIGEHFKHFKNIKRFSVHETVDNETNRLNFAQHSDFILSCLHAEEVYIGVELLEHRLMRTSNGDFDFQEIPTRLDRTLKTDHINLKFAAWITREDLLNLEVKTAILGENKLTENDLNAFIKQWLNSESNELYWLEVKVAATRNVDLILEGLTVEPDTYRLDNSKCSCPYRRFDKSECVPFDFPEDAKQVTRPNGIDMASISITEDVFFFHVRNDGPITIPRPIELPPTAEEQNLEAAMRQAEQFVGIIREDFVRHRFNMRMAEGARERRDEDHERMIIEIRQHAAMNELNNLRAQLQNLQEQRGRQQARLRAEEEIDRFRRREQRFQRFQ
uniref:FBA_2 domain-containing protein n=1 Tax=Caenorhabditis tropicalis TaxID=1561998 RepID=A0A1I7UHS6_9PELO